MGIRRIDLSYWPSLKVMTIGLGAARDREKHVQSERRKYPIQMPPQLHVLTVSRVQL
jgi:hypothetical protein